MSTTSDPTGAEHLSGPGRRAWADLSGDPADLARLTPPHPPLGLTARLDVDGLLGDSAALATLALQTFDERRNHRTSSAPVRVSGDRVRCSAQSERHLTLNGEAPEVWAPLSGFWRASDGWIRSHANYPHHAARFAQLLDLPPDAGREEVGAAVARRSAIGLEDEAADLGAVVGAVREPEAWAAHPQARAVADLPLVGYVAGSPGGTPPGDGPLLTGIRVLDLTRVLAGPIAARNLAHSGARVLRIDSPRLPEIGWQHTETGSGKRSALLDLTSSGDRSVFWGLLEDADVLLLGYRPGALDARGLSFEALQERRPGLVVARVSAWGPVGPWAGRRGFDSIVQAVTGIARKQSTDGRTPGALPAQALDHAAGHLLTAGIARALTDRLLDGTGRRVDVALARVAHALLETRECPATTATPRDITQTGRTEQGEIRLAAPPLLVAGAPEEYPRLATPWGSDAATWEDR